MAAVAMKLALACAFLFNAAGALDAAGWAKGPEDQLAQEMTHDLEMNFNRPLFPLRAMVQVIKKKAVVKRRRRAERGFEPVSVLKSTEKAANAALLIQRRCNACHGRTVRDVLGAMVDGSRYKMADLRYDINHGRLEVLAPGSAAGPLPAGKVRKDAPLAGKPLPPASIEEFFQFLQCQLVFQTKQLLGKDVELKDKGAKDMWPDEVEFVTPNLGATERWVPYHTVLGVHEVFLVESVHSQAKWSEKQRFTAMFIFRAHCKRDLFTKAQLPLMLTKAFWQDPIKAFADGGPMEQAILEYRKKTGNPLLTSCFRIIPERVLKDDTKNLVRSITTRSQRLIAVADSAFAIVKDKKKSAAEKMHQISAIVQDAPGLGETWAKMLTVCIDLAYPKQKLLESQCDVGIGAAPPLRCLLPKGGPTDRKEALKALLKIANSSKGKSTQHFWSVLKQCERHIRAKYKKLRLICAQANTRRGKMSACTLQVQLCEYRQFRHALARNKYGLADDESMRGEAETTSSRLHASDFMEVDKRRGLVVLEFPAEGKKIPIQVSIQRAKSAKVAGRVAALCFEKLRGGASKQEVELFRDGLLKDYKGGQDVPPDSEAWEACRATISHVAPLVSFQCKDERFQTTQAAAGGLLEAERVARLCWAKFDAGVKRAEVLEFRNALYGKINPSGTKPRSDGLCPPGKRRRMTQ